MRVSGLGVILIWMTLATFAIGCEGVPESDVEAGKTAEDGGSEATATTGAPADTVRVEGGDGKSYSCPRFISSELDPKDDEIKSRQVVLGNLKRKTKPVKKRLGELKAQYPSGTAPGAVADEFNALVADYNRAIRRGKQLTVRHNALVREYNGILEAECTEGGGGGLGLGVRGRRRRGR